MLEEFAEWFEIDICQLETVHREHREFPRQPGHPVQLDSRGQNPVTKRVVVERVQAGYLGIQKIYFIGKNSTLRKHSMISL